MTHEREAAWFAVHEALPARWHVGPVTFDPGRHAFSVTARGPHPGRGKAPVTVSGDGRGRGGRAARPGRQAPRRAET